MSKLRVVTPTTGENNLEVFISKEPFGIQPILVRGGTYSHSFTVPFICSEVLQTAELKIIYSQGAYFSLEASADSIVEDKKTGTSYITFKLTPEETLRFPYTLRDTSCQLKFVTLENEVFFSVEHEIIVHNSLFSN